MQVQVRTTQNVFIHYPVGSVGDRILAYLVDTLIIIVFAISIVIFYINIKVEAPWIWIITLGGPILFYHLVFEIFMDGQSPGKRAMQLKVLRLDGTPATVGDYLLRWVFGFVDIQMMSGVIAILCIAIGEKGQRLGDMVAGTTVVKLIQEHEVSAANVFIAKQEQDYVPTFPQVTQLTDDDIEVIRRALDMNRELGNMEPVMAVTEKIKAVLGVQTDLQPVKFLYTVIKDFQHLTSL